MKVLMLSRIKLLFRQSMAIAALSALLLFFQNCSAPAPSSNPEYKLGGTGVDGKGYRSYGDCGTQVGLSGIIDVSSDLTNAKILREDCQDLSSPKTVDISNLTFSNTDDSVFAFNGRVFDRQISAVQEKITLKFCQSSGMSPEVQALVWVENSNLSAFRGVINLSKSESSGPLNAQQISANHYASSTGQPAQFDLSLSNSTNGSLSYSLPSGKTASSIAVTCSTQSPPLIIQQSSVGTVMHSPTTYGFDIKPTGAGRLLVVGVVYGYGAQQHTDKITDNAGNTYAMVPGSAGYSHYAGTTEIWYAIDSKPGATHVTVTEGGAWRPDIFFVEVSGINVADPLDGPATVRNAQPASTTAVAPPITTGGQNAFVFSVLTTEKSLFNLDASTGFTAMPKQSGDGAAYIVPFSPGTYGTKWSQTSGTYAGSTAAFKAAW